MKNVVHIFTFLSAMGLMTACTQADMTDNTLLPEGSCPLELNVATRNLPNNRIEITIKDNGIGMKKDDLKKIFEKFYRVSTGNRHDVKGFGLGLAYVHKMVTELKGDIRAESEINKGSKFIITLPTNN